MTSIFGKDYVRDPEMSRTDINIKTYYNMFDQTSNYLSMIEQLIDISEHEIELDDTLPLNEQLQSLREQMGFSLNDCADLFGIAVNAYRHYETRMVKRYRVPPYDLLFAPVNSENIIMQVDEMGNGDLMIHPNKQNTPVHVIHAMDRDFFFDKIAEISAYYKKIDPKIKLYYNIPDYVIKRNTNNDFTTGGIAPGTPSDKELRWFYPASDSNKKEILAKNKEILKDVNLARRRKAYGEKYREYQRKYRAKKKEERQHDIRSEEGLQGEGV